MINLQKGQKVNLSKESGTPLRLLYAGLGWDANTSTGAAFDADVSVVFTGDDNQKTSDEDFIFYNRLSNEFCTHSGDNRSGDGDGDDESLIIELDKVPARITKIHVYVTIHEAEINKQNFGMLNNAMIHMRNDESKEELAKFELDFDASTSHSVRFGTVVRRADGWYFSAENVDMVGGLMEILPTHGFVVG